MEDFRVRAWPSYARKVVEERDEGVCRRCGLDCRLVAASINRQIRRHGRDRKWAGKVLDQLRIAHSRTRFKKVSAWGSGYGCRHFGIPPAIWSVRWQALWDMDHIVPVVEGGGGCGLDNLRTLCRSCHLDVTADLARRRAERRRHEGV